MPRPSGRRGRSTVVMAASLPSAPRGCYTAGWGHARRLRPGQVRRHAERGRGSRGDGPGWARRAPDDELVQVPDVRRRSRVRRRAARCAGRASCDAVTVTGPYGEPTPAAILRVGRHGVRRERAGRRAAPHRAGAPRPRAGNDARPRGAARPRPSTRAPAGWSSASVAPPPTTPAPACSSALGATAEGGSLDEGPAGLAELTLRGPERGPASRARASSWSWPATSTTRCSGSPAPPRSTGRRRGCPRSGWSPSTAGCSTSPSSPTASWPATKGAGAAGGLGFALMLLGGSRTPGVDLVAEAVGLAEKVRRRRPRGDR